MKVYVVIWDNGKEYEDNITSLVGVFSSQYRANQWIEDHPQETDFGITPFFMIFEREIDKADDWK